MPPSTGQHADALTARWWQRGLTAFFTLVAGVWGTGALYFQAHPAWALLWGLVWSALLFASVWGRQLRAVRWAGALGLAAVLLWWSQLQPQSQRDWADDVAHLARIESIPSEPDVVILRQVRNFAWRTESDYTARWETRRMDLRQLRTLDLGVSYWMGPAIAHTLVSFGFADGQQLVFSIEIRKERHEQFDALAGFFRQYELALIAADERDILGVRTNVRGETVHLYRIQLPPSALRALFLAYAQQAQDLADTPRFYNTLTANCTTLVWQLARSVGQALPLDVRLLASGYVPQYLHALGALTPGMPLATLRERGNITTRAQQWQPSTGSDDATVSAHFSHWIRQGMPTPAPP